MSNLQFGLMVLAMHVAAYGGAFILMEFIR